MNTTPTTPTEAITAALAAHPESSAAELAEAAGIGGSTASKHLATLERDGIVVRHLGGHEGGRRVADRWALADTRCLDRARRRGRRPAADEDASATRLHKGELSTLVLDYLKAHGERRDRSERTRQGARSIFRCGRERVPAPRILGRPPPRERLAAALPDRRGMTGAHPVPPSSSTTEGPGRGAISKDNGAPPSLPGSPRATSRWSLAHRRRDTGPRQPRRHQRVATPRGHPPGDGHRGGRAGLTPRRRSPSLASMTQETWPANG